MTKPEPQWRIIVISGKKAEILGRVAAPNADAAIRKAADQFGVTGERRKRLVAQPIAPRTPLQRGRIVRV
jgi:hypothetical protein